MGQKQNAACVCKADEYCEDDVVDRVDALLSVSVWSVFNLLGFDVQLFRPVFVRMLICM